MDSNALPEVEQGLSIQDRFGKKVGETCNRFIKYLNPTPEEQREYELKLISFMEGGGFLRRAHAPLTENEYPDEWKNVRTILGAPLEEIIFKQYEKKVGKYEPVKPISKKRKLALALLQIPVAALGMNIPGFIQSLHSAAPDSGILHPSVYYPGDSTMAQLDVQAYTHSQCSVDVYTPDGALIKSIKSTGDPIVKMTDFSTSQLLGTDCAPEKKEALKAAKIDGRTYVVDMIAWAAYLEGISRSWHSDAMMIDKAHTVTIGSPDVRIAIIEHQFDPNHLEFRGQDIQAIDGKGSPYKDPTVQLDSSGKPVAGIRFTSSLIDHGTMVTGLIGARLTGIAPGSSLAFIQGEKFGTAIGGVGEKTIQAIKFAVDKENDVITMSFGGEGFHDKDYKALKPIFDKAQKQGTFIILAAGNSAEDPYASFDPKGTLATLAKEYPNVILVGATDQAGHLASFSQLGETVAPGDKIVGPNREARSQIGQTSISITIDGQEQKEAKSTVTAKDLLREGYGKNSGTSYSTPLIAGTIALALSINPELKHHPDEMGKMLAVSAKYNSGYGVNAWYMTLMSLHSRSGNFPIDYDEFLMQNK